MQPAIRGNPGGSSAVLCAALAPQGPVLAVLDTNVLLDLWLFRNPGTLWLAQALRLGTLRWVATPDMLKELALVAARPYPERYTPEPELESPPCMPASPPKPCTALRCRDRSDQMFVDLGWALQAPLLTRDRALLALKRRAMRLGLLIDTPEAMRARWLQAPDLNNDRNEDIRCAP